MEITSTKVKKIFQFIYIGVLPYLLTTESVLAVQDIVELSESEETFYSEIPSVISATRIRQPLTEVPSSVTVIDRNMIDASGAVEVADILRLVPGVQVSYPQGNQIAVAYHGFADAFPRNMQVLIDGRSIYQPSFSDVDWLFVGVSIDNIERIEVVRGPNSPLYGSNAVQGVINIITYQPLQQMGAYVSTTVGSLDTRNTTVRYVDRAGQLDYRITAGYQTSTGLPGELDSTDDGRQIGSLSFRGALQQSLNDEIDIQFGIDSGRLGAGAELPDDPEAHKKNVSANYQYINWRHVFKNGADSRLLFYRNMYKSVDNYPQLLSDAFNVSPDTISFLFEGLPDQIIDLGLYNYEGERYDLEWQYTSEKHGKWRAIFGTGLRLNTLKSPVLTRQKNRIEEKNARIFANIDYYPVSSLIAGLGVMAEKSNQYYSYISPRLSLNYLISPQHSIRISYTEVQRNPSLIEKNFNHVLMLRDGTDILNINKNIDPKPETKTSSEIGFIGYWFNKDLLLDIKIFHEKTKDVIHEMRTDDAQPFFRIEQSSFVYGNDGVLEMNGVEAQIKYQFGLKSFISLQYAHIGAKSTLRRLLEGNALWERPSKSVPDNTYSALLNYSFSKNIDVSLAYYAMSEMYWLGDGDLIDDYQRWDFRISKKNSMDKKPYKIELLIQNMGQDYETFRYSNVFETRVYLRLSIEL